MAYPFRPQPLRPLSDERGSVTTEYAVLLMVVALGCALGVAALGVPLFGMYLTNRVWLMLPFP